MVAGCRAEGCRDTHSPYERSGASVHDAPLFRWVSAFNGYANRRNHSNSNRANVRLQPRRVMISPAAVGCKPC